MYVVLYLLSLQWEYLVLSTSESLIAYLVSVFMWLALGIHPETVLADTQFTASCKAGQRKSLR